MKTLAAVEGLPVLKLRLLLLVLLALVVTVAMKAVGSLLITALLVAPTLVARPLANTPTQMVLLAGLASMIAMTMGLLSSFYWDTAVGASIVLSIALLFIIVQIVVYIKENYYGRTVESKHKEIAANAKGRVFGKLSKEIMVAARNGADPAMNPRLRLAVEQAKKASMPRDTLERAIKKGAGLLDGGVNFEKVTYEGFAPHRVPIIVECLTDNVNRTISSMRVLFRKGQLGASGSVAWDFDHLGMIEAGAATPSADVELAAIEAGAEDFEPIDEDGVALFYTAMTDVDIVSHALPEHGFTVQSVKLGYRAKNPVSLSDAEREEVEAFLDNMDADDDVQHVYVGLA